MSIDPDSKGATASDPAPATGPPTETARAPRALGRGLEEVSHVFLQRSPAEPPPSARAPRGTEPTSVVATRAGTLLLRPSTRITREHVLITLKELSGALEDGLRVFDNSLPCDPFGEIDLLAVDRSNRLAVIDLAVAADDGLLLRGLSHLDWTTRNAANLKRMNPGLVADFTHRPRLLLVAPQFSPRLKSAIHQAGGLEVACFRYHGVDISDRIGIFFERVDGQG